MLYLAVLTVLATGAWCQTMMMPMDMPKKCCIPDTWQAHLVDLKSEYMTISEVVWDYNKKQEGVWTTSRTDGTLIAHTLIDYNKKMMYSADYYSDPNMPKCNTTKFDMPMIKCLDDPAVMDLKPVGSSTLGLNGTGLFYNGWSYKLGEVEITSALVPIPNTDLCYPILENVKTDTMDGLYMFLEIITTPKNPEIVAMPAPCVGAASAVVG